MKGFRGAMIVVLAGFCLGLTLVCVAACVASACPARGGVGSAAQQAPPVVDLPPPVDGRSSGTCWQVYDPVQRRLRWVSPADAARLDEQPGGRMNGVKPGGQMAGLLFTPRMRFLGVRVVAVA